MTDDEFFHLCDALDCCQPERRAAKVKSKPILNKLINENERNRRVVEKEIISIVRLNKEKNNNNNTICQESMNYIDKNEK